MERVVTQISWFFLFAFALQGITAISVLLIKNRPLQTANVLLVVNLLGITMVAMVITLVESGLMLQMPHFFRLPSPLYYAMFPAAYLYVKLVITDRTQLKKWDYLHFLPAFMHLIEMVPFYLKSAEEKMISITSVMQQHIQLYEHNEGWLPSYVHNIIRGAIGLVYGVLIWRIVGQSFKGVPPASYHAVIKRWLLTLGTINFAIGLFAILFLTLLFIPAPLRASGLSLVFLVTLSVANFYLFYRPEILYGMPRSVFDTERHDSSPQVVMNLSKSLSSSPREIPEFIAEYQSKVDQYMHQSKRFLEPDLGLKDIARDTGIPVHHLKLMINGAEQKKINEYINEYRIKHLKKRIVEGAIKHKTLEGLAIDCGFGSKATFIRAVKKLTGKTPREYFLSTSSNTVQQTA
jgi:AraC-like DNA-binding protein